MREIENRMGYQVPTPSTNQTQAGQSTSVTNAVSTDNTSSESPGTHLTSRQTVVAREMGKFAQLRPLIGLFQLGDREGGSGRVASTELLALLHLVSNAFTAQLLAHFDPDADNTVSLAGFIVGVARFNSWRIADRKAWTLNPKP